MNNKGLMLARQLVGIVVFVLFLVLFVYVLYKVWPFSKTSEEENAVSKLDEVLRRIDYMVEENVSLNKESVRMDEPLDWYLVEAGNKLCICKMLAETDESQGDVCEKYGGSCAEFEYNFEIDNYEEQSRGDGYMGRQNAIKLEGWNFLVIQRSKENFFTFRKNVAETDMNSLLNGFLDSYVIYSGQRMLVRNYIKNACEQPKLFSEEVFEKSFESFFSGNVAEGTFVKLSFRRDLKSYTGSNLPFEFYYPASGKNKNFDTDYKSNEVLADYCVVELSSIKN